MSNDPKDATVDLSKFLIDQASAGTPLPTIPSASSASMITSCCENIVAIRYELSSQEKPSKKEKK